MRKTTAMALIGLLAACGSGEGPLAPAETYTTLATTTSTGDEVTTVTKDNAEVVEAAKADLAGRLGVDPGRLEVLTAKQVTWSDGSLGCPEPGRMYTQALVEGYQVVLKHGDRVYDYHAGSDGRPFLCPSDDQGGGHQFVRPPGFDE